MAEEISNKLVLVDIRSGHPNETTAFNQKRRRPNMSRGDDVVCVCMAEDFIIDIFIV